MKFACVLHGAVVQYFQDMPFSFGGITRFRSLTSEQQAAAGILPVVDLTPVLDSALERLAKVPLSVTVYRDRVEIRRLVRSLTEEEITARFAELRAGDVAAKRASALRVLDEQRLNEAALDLGAPQEVKDYTILVGKG